MSADYGTNKQFSHFELTDITDENRKEEYQLDKCKMKTKTKGDREKKIPHVQQNVNDFYDSLFWSRNYQKMNNQQQHWQIIV